MLYVHYAIYWQTPTTPVFFKFRFQLVFPLDCIFDDWGKIFLCQVNWSNTTILKRVFSLLYLIRLIIVILYIQITLDLYVKPFVMIHKQTVQRIVMNLFYSILYTLEGNSGHIRYLYVFLYKNVQKFKAL